jgi:hypothetical protein
MCLSYVLMNSYISLVNQTACSGERCVIANVSNVLRIGAEADKSGKYV